MTLKGTLSCIELTVYLFHALTLLQRKNLIIIFTVCIHTYLHIYVCMYILFRCYSRVITSERAGMGKSLYIQRLLQRFKKQYRYQIVTFHGPDISTDMVVRTLQETKSEQCTQPVVYHLDVSEKVCL